MLPVLHVSNYLVLVRFLISLEILFLSVSLGFQVIVLLGLHKVFTLLLGLLLV